MNCCNRRRRRLDLSRLCLAYFQYDCDCGKDNDNLGGFFATEIVWQLNSRHR